MVLVTTVNCGATSCTFVGFYPPLCNEVLLNKSQRDPPESNTPPDRRLRFTTGGSHIGSRLLII